MKKIVCILLCLTALNRLAAQESLPNFSVVERGKKVIISWVNPYESCIQLNVQRSYDSLKYFRTIYAAPSPGLPQNGFSEPRQPNAKTYYRIFYVLQGGTYFFTPAKQAVPDTDARTVNFDDRNLSAFKSIKISTRGVEMGQISSLEFVRFKDSILRQTKDTLFAINDSLVELRRFIAKEIWKPSNYIFTSKDGYLNIMLNNASAKKYHVKFFEENGIPLFEVKSIKEDKLTLDKANFVHAGWFMFELYEDNKLKEKNKFYLPKDF